MASKIEYKNIFSTQYYYIFAQIVLTLRYFV